MRKWERALARIDDKLRAAIAARDWSEVNLLAGQRLDALRAEEYLCRRREYYRQRRDPEARRKYQREYQRDYRAGRRRR